MRWVKWYAIDWINSTARDEMTPEERGTFVDFVCLARFPGSPPGTFKFASWEALARKLNTPLPVIISTRDKCLINRITVANNKEGYIVTVLNWGKYQGLGHAVEAPDNTLTQSGSETDNNIALQRRGEKKRGEKSREEKGKGKPGRAALGEAANVHLSPEEVARLKGRFCDLPERIEALSVYKASTGKSYKSDYYTILNWDRMAKKGAHAVDRGFVGKRGSMGTREEHAAQARRFNTRPGNTGAHPQGQRPPAGDEGDSSA